MPETIDRPFHPATSTGDHASGPASAGAEPRPFRSAVLELRVRNHPGTMLHVTGLFARRAFNLEAITCAPVGDGRVSRMLLLVAEEPRLEQVERQLEKLHDVLSVQHRPDIAPEFFARFGGAA